MMEKTFLAAALSLLLLCAGIGGVVLLYLWLISYVSLMQRQRRRLQSAENGKSPRQGLSAADLQRLPTIECHEEGEQSASTGRGGDNAECAVCLEPFQIGDLCRVIPACSHAFHVQCADAWLSKRSVCPICRRSAREEENKDVNGGAAVALQEESVQGHDEEIGRCPPPPVESIVVDMPIAIAPT